MYLLDTYYPNYATVFEMPALNFAIVLGATIYLLHVTDLIHIWVYCRACNGKRSRFLLFVYDLLVLAGLYELISIIVMVVTLVTGITTVTIAGYVIGLSIIGLAVFAVQYLIIVIGVTKKARHLYLAAQQDKLIDKVKK